MRDGTSAALQPRASEIGRTIRRFRRAEGLTLKQLAERSGVSIATISKIENGKISGGFETVYKIARGLGVLVTEIVPPDGADSQPFAVHRHDPADLHATSIYHYFPQAFRRQGVLNTYLMEIRTRRVPERRDWSIHAGEEVIFVLEGTIELHLEGHAPVRLEAGDSACFDCGLRHAFVAVGEGNARILSVSTRGPATRNDGRLVFS